MTPPPPLPSRASPPFLPDELRQVAMDSEKPAKQYTVPRPPEGWDKTRWLGAQDEIEIAGIVIRGGLFYTGPRLTTPGTRENEPSLVNGVLAVGRYGDYRSTTRYWGGYADFEPAERHAYLKWLASDRTDPSCAIQYVRLFLFGLERRILLDSVNDPESKQDWPAIEAMLRRLSSAYAAVLPNVHGHVNSLLDWMASTEAGDQLYNAPLPAFERSYELPFYIRLALGQCSLDRVPVPAALATAWVRLNPEIPLRTAATRCAEEFDRLFALRYQETFGPGMVLPKNRTKLKFTRRPFNPALDRTDAGTKTFGDIPDVTALRVPLKALQELVSQCTEDLGAFNRLVGKNPEARQSIEGTLLLPPEIWPLATRTALAEVASDVQTANLSIKLTDLLGRLGAVGTTLGKDKIRELARALEQSKVGMEPNVLEGARVPGENDPIVLFALLPDQTHRTDAQAYQTAQLTLQLGSTVAQSDGAFSAHELEHLSREIESWTHLSEGIGVDCTRTSSSLRWRRFPCLRCARSWIRSVKASRTPSQGPWPPLPRSMGWSPRRKSGFWSVSTKRWAWIPLVCSATSMPQHHRKPVRHWPDPRRVLSSSTPIKSLLCSATRLKFLRFSPTSSLMRWWKPFPMFRRKAVRKRRVGLPLCWVWTRRTARCCASCCRARFGPVPNWKMAPLTWN